MGSRGTASTRAGNAPPSARGGTFLDPDAPPAGPINTERISKVELGRLRNSIYTAQAKRIIGSQAKSVEEVSPKALRVLNSNQGQEMITNTLEIERVIKSNRFKTFSQGEQDRWLEGFRVRRKNLYRIWNG